MKIKLILCAFLSLFTNCLGQKKVDLKVPDYVAIDNSIERIRIPGTKVLVHKPSDYVLFKNLLRIEKNDSTFIQVMEIPNANFNEKIKDIKKSIEDKTKEGVMTACFYQKELKLGPFNANLFYCLDHKPNMEQIMLAFGDNSFSVLAVGEFPLNDKTARQEILNELLKIKVDTSLNDDIDALKSFEVDLSNTAFKFNSKMSQMYSYTVNGEGDPNQDPYRDNIIIIPLTPISPSDFKERTTDMISRLQRAGIKINTTRQREVNFQGTPGLETIMDGEFKGQKNKMYFLMSSNEKNSVMFYGETFAATDTLFPQIARIAKTLIIK